MQFAKIDTAKNVLIGPILDSDGVAKTDEVVGNIKLSVNGGAPGALDGSATLTHRNTGHYSLALQAADIDTLGTADVVLDSGTNAMQPVRLQVVPANVYDSLVSGSDYLDVNLAQWLDTAPESPDTAGVPKVDTKLIDGSDATDQLRAYSGQPGVSYLGYIGDYKEDADIRFTFSSYDHTGAPITMATDGTIHVRNQTSGVNVEGTAVTFYEDSHATGVHGVLIELDDNANIIPNRQYTIWLEDAVIDGVTVSAALGAFSIECEERTIPSAHLNGTLGANVKQWLGTAPATPNTAGVPVVDVEYKAGGKYKIADTTGNWNAAGTWADGSVPSAGDNIIIRDGVTVTVSADLDLGLYGTLELQGDGELEIDSGVTVAVVPRGWVIKVNGGTITMNYGTVMWNNNSGTITCNYGGVVARNFGTILYNMPGGMILQNVSTGTIGDNSEGEVTYNYNGATVNGDNTVGLFLSSTAYPYQTGDCYPKVEDILEDTAETFYQAAVHVERKASVDEYTVAVLQNGQLFTGSITSCSIAMVKRADGTELFAATAMTAVDDGIYKLDQTATRTAADTGYIAVVTVVIAGVTYTLAAPVHTSA